jgi:two-component system NtrC family response regulator
LAAHLLGKLARKNKKKPPRLSPQFLEALKGYSWPGNIRELENVLERGLVMTASDTLEPRDLPEKVRQNPEGQKKADSLEEAEKNALLQALELNDYHREKTAEYLGVSRRTLQYKLRKYGLTREQKNRE